MSVNRGKNEIDWEYSIQTVPRYCKPGTLPPESEAQVSCPWTSLGSSYTFPFSAPTIRVMLDNQTLFIEGTNFEIQEWVFGVPGDVSTISQGSETFDYSLISGNLFGFYISRDGTNLLIGDRTLGIVHQRTLSVPFKLSTVSTAGTSYSIDNIVSGPKDIYVFNDGLSFLVLDEQGGIFEFSMNTPWNLDNVQQIGGVKEIAGFGTIAAFSVNPVETQVAMVTTGPDTLIGFSLETPGEWSTLSEGSCRVELVGGLDKDSITFLNDNDRVLVIEGFATQLQEYRQ